MIALAPQWADDGYALRPAHGRDRKFQRLLFAAARPDAALIARWPPAQGEAFLDRQFALQDVHYRRFYSAAKTFIVMHDGAAIGRLIVDQDKRGWRLIDIAIMPERRGRGLGTALLRGVQDACAAAGGKTLALQVEAGNPAQRLYARCGFVPAGDIGGHVEMAWTAAAQLKTAS